MTMCKHMGVLWQRATACAARRHFARGLCLEGCILSSALQKLCSGTCVAHFVQAGIRSTHSPYAVSTLALILVLQQQQS